MSGESGRALSCLLLSVIWNCGNPSRVLHKYSLL